MTYLCSNCLNMTLFPGAVCLLNCQNLWHFRLILLLAHCCIWKRLGCWVNFNMLKLFTNIYLWYCMILSSVLWWILRGQICWIGIKVTKKKCHKFYINVCNDAIHISHVVIESNVLVYFSWWICTIWNGSKCNFESRFEISKCFFIVKHHR